MKKTLLTSLFAFSLSFLSFAQTQIGTDLDGESSGDEFGRSVSMPDPHTLGIGASKNDGTASNAGHGRIYRWNGTAWVQKGQDLDGEASGDLLGFSISMPDSNNVAIGGYQNDGAGSNAGHVRVYFWNGTSWTQKGQDIDGEAAGDESGRSVSMPDSNTVAIGATKNDGNGSNAGHARIYRWNGTSWVQKGADIDGEAAGDQAGFSISMPDSNTVAIGANLNDGNGTSSGHARIYRWDGTSWVQKGVDIDGETAGDQTGISISMPDSNTVAIGANYGVDVNNNNTGHARIFTWNGTAWIQKGLDIDGEADGDLFGRVISMADSNSIAVGGLFNDGNGNASGHARAFKWDGSSWNQVGVEIDGEAAGDRFGTVSMSDPNTVAISGYQNDGNGSNSGHVQVYDLCIADTTIDVQLACDSLIWIDGVTYTTSNNTATYLYTNVAGCDSLIMLDLTIGTSDSIVQTETACNTYTWAVNNQTYTSTGIYTVSMTNSTGCDSIMTLDLTLNSSNTGSQTENACGSYTWLANNQTYNTSGNYTTTLTNAVGCDSVVTLNLTIHNNDTTMQTEVACNSYTWSENNQTYTATGAYSTTLTNSSGCDSVLILDLTVNYNDTTYQTEVACDSYTWLVDNQTYMTSGIYSAILTNSAGCDSVVILDLTINNSTISSQTETACGSYIWSVDNQTYTSTGTYTVTLTNAIGCDSVVTLNLTVNPLPDVTTSLSQQTITVAEANATYQWLECDNGNYTPIDSETNQSFTATVNGDYAVEVTLNNCVDTSSCTTINSVGLIENSFGNDLIVFPNPATNKITIKGDVSFTKDLEYTLINAQGQLVNKGTISAGSTAIDIDLEQYSKGIYNLNIVNQEQLKTFSIVVM